MRLDHGVISVCLFVSACGAGAAERVPGSERFSGIHSQLEALQAEADVFCRGPGQSEVRAQMAWSAYEEANKLSERLSGEYKAIHRALMNPEDTVRSEQRQSRETRIQEAQARLRQESNAWEYLYFRRTQGRSSAAQLRAQRAKLSEAHRAYEEAVRQETLPEVQRAVASRKASTAADLKELGKLVHDTELLSGRALSCYSLAKGTSKPSDSVNASASPTPADASGGSSEASTLQGAARAAGGFPASM